MYTFLLVNPNGTIPTFEFAPCPDPETARSNALSLLARYPERAAVEVWDEHRRLCVVDREQLCA